MKATKKELSEKRRRQGFPKNCSFLLWTRRFFYGARVLPALLRVRSRCHHLDVFALSAHAIADVCVTKENLFFLFQKIRSLL
jgi:hypothetical protein